MENRTANSLLNQAKRRTGYSGSIAILITSVLLIIIVVYPQVRHIIETRDNISKKKEQVAALKVKSTELSQNLLKTDYFVNNDMVQIALPNSKPLLETLTSLDQVKRASEVEMFDLKTNPGLLASGSGQITAGSKPIADSMILEFSIKGTFEKVSQFMDLLEKVAPFTTITSFEIAGVNQTTLNPDPNAPELIQVTVKTKTFFYNPTVVQAITTALPKLNQENTIVLAKLAEFMTIPLPEQRQITGGGSEDIFGVATIEGL